MDIACVKIHYDHPWGGVAIRGTRITNVCGLDVIADSDSEAFVEAALLARTHAPPPLPPSAVSACTVFEEVFGVVRSSREELTNTAWHCEPNWPRCDKRLQVERGSVHCFANALEKEALSRNWIACYRKQRNQDLEYDK
ncbi:MAG: hypothetical protein R3C53_22370 [Pirellulaceae bacterium]